MLARIRRSCCCFEEICLHNSGRGQLKVILGNGCDDSQDLEPVELVEVLLCRSIGVCERTCIPTDVIKMFPIDSMVSSVCSVIAA